MNSSFLSVSIVVYRPDQALLASTLSTLSQALQITGRTYSLWIVDNAARGAADDVRHIPAVSEILAQFAQLHVMSGHGNVGYGAGHNLAIQLAQSEYHLILNPDVELSNDSLQIAVDWMNTNLEFGLLAPRTSSPSGATQYLCRRYPSLWLLFLRGFAPAFLRRIWRRSLADYEMREAVGRDTVVTDPTLISGCFMFFRTTLLHKVGGFDARYFLYFEDYDLSLRTAKQARLAYVPSVRIVHHGGDASKKGFLHVKLFVRSARLFFSMHGWQLC